MSKKTFRQLHDMTDKAMGIKSGRWPGVSVDGARWHLIFEYLDWKYNTPQRAKANGWRLTKARLGLS